MASGFPRIDTFLHDPGRAGVAQDVRRHALELCGLNRCRERPAQLIDFLTVVMAHILAIRPIDRSPPLQMCKDTAAQLHLWCALVLCFSCTRCAPRHDPALEIDPRPFESHQHAGTTAGVDSEQDESSKVWCVTCLP